MDPKAEKSEEVHKVKSRDNSVMNQHLLRIDGDQANRSKRKLASNRPWEPEIEIMAVDSATHDGDRTNSFVPMPHIKKTKSKLKCSDCGFRSSNAALVSSHRVVVHFKKKSLRCPLCAYATCFKGSLKHHFVLVHERDLCSCKFCGHQCQSGAEMDSHMKRHNSQEDLKIPIGRMAAAPECGTEDPVNFACDSCECLFKSRLDLAAHVGTHSHEQSFQCSHCNEWFKRLSNLYSHMAQVHSQGLDRLSRENCGEEFAHRQFHSQEQPFACPHCDKRFKKHCYVTSHVVRRHTHGVDRAFVCGACDRGFKIRSDLVQHQKIHSEEQPYKCPHCSKAFCQSAGLRSHVARKHGQDDDPNRFACETCGRPHRTRSMLVEHRRTHTQERPFKCLHCEKSFNKKSNRKAHMSRRHGPKPDDADPTSLICKVCGLQTVSREAFVTHVRTHNPPVEKNHKCPQCDYAASGQGLLNTHLNVVHGVGPSRFVCEICGRRCHSRVVLARHNLTHTKEKPFKCEQCLFECSQKGTLKQHVDTRHGVGRFRCDDCGKVMRSAGQLEMHQRMHTNEKPYNCPHCDHQSSRKDNLHKHMEAVHGHQKHVCSICGRLLSSARLLDRHRQKIHNLEKIPKASIGAQLETSVSPSSVLKRKRSRSKRGPLVKFGRSPTLA